MFASVQPTLTLLLPTQSMVKIIDHKTLHEDLGILFSSDLSWTEHYNHVTSKAYKTLGLLHRTFKSNNTQTKKLLYISLVCSQLIYCSQLWRPHALDQRYHTI